MMVRKFKLIFNDIFIFYNNQLNNLNFYELILSELFKNTELSIRFIRYTKLSIYL